MRSRATRRRPVLPAATATSPSRSARACSSPRCASPSADPDRCRAMRPPARILVVDDTPDNVEVLKVRLESQGYEVLTAADGEEGLAKIQAETPDLVLLDIMMPKLDGIEVCRRVKADAALPFIPIIMVTA